jgi:hydrogenase maturation protein HypF
LTENVVGLACDGTGYGTDGIIWGSEVLLCNFDEGEFRRAGFLRPFSLLGGDAAAIETYRPALGVLVETFGTNWPAEAQNLIRNIDSQALTLAIARLGAPSARLPRTTSLGRLFDAAAFLLGLCTRNDTEAQAPIAVQRAAEKCDDADPLHYSLEETSDGAIVMDYRPMIRAMVKQGGEKKDPAGEPARPQENVQRLARGFHEGLATMLAETVLRVCEATKEHRVVLSGGCFLNALLLERTEELLRRDGCEVYTHQSLSPGDENVAVGQALVAAARMKKGTL